MKNILLHTSLEAGLEHFLVDECMRDALAKEAPGVGGEIIVRTLQESIREMTENVSGSSKAPTMPHSIGVKDLGNPLPDAIIWTPSHNDTDWFAKLAEEGYTGQRVLLATSRVAKGNLAAMRHNATMSFVLSEKHPRDVAFAVWKAFQGVVKS